MRELGRRLRRHLPDKAYQAVRYGYLSLVDLRDFVSGRRNPLVPPKSKIFVGAGDFLEVGRRSLSVFVEQGGLKPTDAVLDVGCGIGRMAVPMTDFLKDGGSFDGFDIVKGGIDWCGKNISPRFPNFRFVHADVFNGHYNPAGKGVASEYRFPYGGDTFDFAFATSLYTHLLEKDALHYIEETARVLKPGGTALMTWFLFDAGVSRASSPVFPELDFRFRIGRCLASSPNDAEAAIAYPEDFVRDSLRSSGLAADYRLFPGSWRGGPEGITAHDVIVVRKAPL